jgi:hypothetical protein
MMMTPRNQRKMKSLIVTIILIIIRIRSLWITANTQPPYIIIHQVDCSSLIDLQADTGNRNYHRRRSQFSSLYPTITHPEYDTTQWYGLHVHSLERELQFRIHTTSIQVWF